MGRTKRLHTHWVPTRPPVATTDRSRFSVMMGDTMHHTGGAPAQLYGAPLHRIWRLLGSSAITSKCSARPAATSKHTTEQHGLFGAVTYFSCKSLSGSQHRGRSHRGGQRHTRAGEEALRPSVCKGCSTPSSNRPPQSHLPVPMPARRASPRVHDHDDGDGLMTGSVLGGGGNILDIGLSHEDRGEIRTHTQHPAIDPRAKVGQSC